ncbi:MAG: zinc-dependent peptidase [Betaproteobacteria bacterium]|uniref:Zinc-dependent peptidase n=1 Tax=Candidatus Proximibacter danicus TaxID=2954365 RepID=A0A9D7JZN3_9PROT|nr:zinc-dependent peptidase [Candidatus Proximibacter danicus]MBK9447711.1 zinc-dependent peptidase [Betaproteobacteria bacterium]
MISGLVSRLFGKPQPPAIPDGLWQETIAQLPFLARLSEEDCQRLRALTQNFLAEKEFTATGGLELDDEMCLAIAVQGCLLVLNLGLEWYRDWVGIIVYPDEFVIPRSIQDEDGIVHEYDEVASGEAWGGGPLLISWRDVQLSGDGYNVVIHEFAHKLDMRNGEADGLPPLHAGLSREHWESTFLAAYDRFCAQVEAAEAKGEETEIDPYAAENPAEFFAVLSEVFFESPVQLLQDYPEIYEQLAAFYRIDPLAKDH